MSREETKKWFKENWFKIWLLVILTISIIGAFYWFEWRPNQILKSCISNITGNGSFRECLLKKGYPLQVNSNNI